MGKMCVMLCYVVLCYIKQYTISVVRILSSHCRILTLFSHMPRFYHTSRPISYILPPLNSIIHHPSCRRTLSVPALTQLALRRTCRPALHPLPTCDLLLSLCNIMQRLACNRLLGMLLRLRCRSALHRLRLACDIFLSLSDLVQCCAVEGACVLFGLG
jgi:hypothetical protein